MNNRLVDYWTETLEVFGHTGQLGTQGENKAESVFTKLGCSVISHSSDKQKQIEGIDLTVFFSEQETHFVDVKRNIYGFFIPIYEEYWGAKKRSTHICHINTQHMIYYAVTDMRNLYKKHKRIQDSRDCWYVLFTHADVQDIATIIEL